MNIPFSQTHQLTEEFFSRRIAKSTSHDEFFNRLADLFDHWERRKEYAVSTLVRGLKEFDPFLITAAFISPQITLVEHFNSNLTLLTEKLGNTRKSAKNIDF